MSTPTPSVKDVYLAFLNKDQAPILLHFDDEYSPGQSYWHRKGSKDSFNSRIVGFIKHPFLSKKSVPTSVPVPETPVVPKAPEVPVTPLATK